MTTRAAHVLTSGQRSSSPHRRMGLGAVGEYKRKPGDFYRTERPALDALLARERFPGRVWEPACGDGAIVLPMRALGHAVHATDLVDRGCPDSTAACDFLLSSGRYDGAIVTNPPFRLWLEFAEHAVVRLGAPKVALYAHLRYLEGVDRSAFYRRRPPARCWVFSRRVPMYGHASGGMVPFCWMVWQAPGTPDEDFGVVSGFELPARLGWIE